MEILIILVCALGLIADKKSKECKEIESIDNRLNKIEAELENIRHYLCSHETDVKG